MTSRLPSFVAPNNAPVQAALAALQSLPAIEPVPAVSMSANGRLLIIGDSAAAQGWAARLAGQREVTVLTLEDSATVDEDAAYAFTVAHTVRLDGHLGAFIAQWEAAGQTQQDTFDVVLDLSPEALIRRVELPSGYVAAGRDPLDQALAIIDLLAFDGEFEKPRYLAVNERSCAHSRSLKVGCSNCIDVCATAAITSAGDRVAVDPYLCQGCGTCTTVCPSGSLSFQYPRVADIGLAIKQQLTAFREAGGSHACLLFHSSEAGQKALRSALRGSQGLPAAVIPIEVWSVDAVGPDLLLGALTLGAAQVAVLGAGSHDLAPLRKQTSIAQTLLNGLGYTGERLRIIDPEQTDWLEQLADWPAASLIAPAEFRLLGDKRTTLEFAIGHLIKHAPTTVDHIDLPAGSPFGSITVSDQCTLCMACTSACPASALKAAADAPRLSFLERNCLQCGLCANTCPEQAIRLTPRLLVKDRRQERVLKEAEIFRCTACGKPMGAAPTILNMISKLSGHSMFATPEAKARLSMCGDCRVVDLIEHEPATRAWEMSE